MYRVGVEDASTRARIANRRIRPVDAPWLWADPPRLADTSHSMPVMDTIAIRTNSVVRGGDIRMDRQSRNPRCMGLRCVYSAQDPCGGCAHAKYTHPPMHRTQA